MTDEELAEAWRQAARNSEIAFADGAIRKKYGDPAEQIATCYDSGSRAAAEANEFTRLILERADQPAAVVENTR